MTTTLNIHATPADTESYHQLLKSELTRKTLDSTLSLLWKLVAAAVNPSKFDWQKILVCPPRVAGKEGLDQHIIATIRNASAALMEARLPPLPATFSPDHPDRLLAQSQQAWTYLCLPLLTGLTGAVDLFVNLQSLLFLGCCHVLLPKLTRRGLEIEQGFLVNALFVHTVVVWRDDPSHEYYLQSVLMDYLGNHDAVLDLRLRSLRLTDVEDHSYLTKAQALWSDMMDLGKHEQAYSFLLDLYRYAPQPYLSEIKEMLSATAMTASGV